MASDYVVGLYEGVSLFEAIKAPRGSVEFTNTSGQLRLTAGPSSATAWTFTTWVKITNDTNFYALWLSLQGASTTYLETGFDITGNGFEVNDLTTERSLGVTATVGTWYFTSISMGASGAVTMFTGPEGGKLTKYTTTLANLSLPLADALLGGELSYEHLDGAMAQTRFWNAVLSDAEVLAEFYSDSPVRTSNIGGHWKLENTTSKLTDSSGASNTLSNPQGTGTYAYLAGPAIGPAPFGAPSENVAVSETIDVVYTPAGGTGYNGNVNETVTVSEALGVVDNAIVGLAETDSLSEALGSAFVGASTLPETDALSEATAATYNAIVAPAETVSVSEALASQSNEASNLPETVSLSEATAASAGFPAGPGETVSFSEAVGAVDGAVVGIGETVTPGESTSAVYGAVVGPAETVSVSEGVSLGGSTNYPEGLPETVSLSESLAVVYSPVVVPAETVMVAIPAMAELPSTDLHLVAEDWTPGSNWSSRVGGFTAQIHGSLTRVGAPDIERNEIRGFSISDYFSLAADTAHELTPSSDITYEFLIRPTSLGGVLMGRYCTPYAGGFDVAQYSAGALMGIFNTAGDDYYRLVVGGVTLDSGYHLLTLVLHSTEDELYLYVDGVLDASVSGFTSDQINSTPADFHIGKSNGNTLGGAFDGGLIEVMRHRTALKPGQVADRVALVGINRVQAGQGFGVGPAETVSLSEARTSVYGAVPSVAETVTVTEGATPAQVLTQGLAETVALSEAAAALAALARAVNETVSLAESLASSIVSTYNLSETVNLAEAVALSQVLTNALAETVALAEAMIGYIPRILVTEVDDPTPLKTAAISAGAKLAVETGTPTAVISAVTAIQGVP